MNVTRRGIFAATVLGAAAYGALRLIKERMPEPDDPYLRVVHTDLREHARKMLLFKGSQPSLSQETLPAIRKQGRSFARQWRTDVPVERRLLPAKGGNPDVPIYLVNVHAGASRGAILYTHGGGFIAGSAADYVRELQDYAVELNCVIVSVDYRLAPETRFSGSVEDNHTALEWLHANAGSIGADPSRIALLGHSAGGGHAALLAIAARDRGVVPIAFQCLIYPMLDDRTGVSRAVSPDEGKLIWTDQDNRFGWKSFLGVEPGSSTVPKQGVPARQEDVSGLPPTFIGVGSIDLFHAESVSYAQRLTRAGVKVELVVVPGAFHGFDGIGTNPALGPVAPISVAFQTALKRALRNALQPAA